MFRIPCRALVGVAAVALAGGVLAVPSSAATRQQEQGIDRDSIQVVDVVPDLDLLIARGLPVGSQTTQGFLQRWTGPVDVFGSIRGRTVETIKVGWDPIDITSFGKACTEAVIDNKPFVVVSGQGFRDSQVPCITVDNDTPWFSGDMFPLSVTKASGKNLISLALPPEVAAKEAVKLLDKTGTLSKTAKVAILGNNIMGPALATDTLQRELEKRDYDVVSVVKANGEAADPNVLRNEIVAAATTFKDAGADVVFNVQSWSAGAGAFFTESERLNYKPQFYAIDGQPNVCAKDGLNRIAAAVEGTICITANDYLSKADGTGIRGDNAAEAKCRATFEATKGFKTTPNMPSGGKTVNGVKYEEDISPWECMVADLLLPAIEKAGKNPTWSKVYDNVMSVNKGPAVYFSNGEGGFAKNKPYYANNIHMMKMAYVDETTPKAADGTYKGCPSPTSCWVPMTVDGKEWYPISASTTKS